MNMKKLSLLALALLISVLPVLSFADEPVVTAIDELWGKPTYVYGAALNEEQIQTTARLLNVDNLENVNMVDVNANDLQHYLGISSNDSVMISSAVVTRTGGNEGINVSIETPENITRVTETQYTNAAITAGIENVDIKIGAYTPVTGESALTGIYKAFEVNGETLDPDRMKVAQDEVEVVSEINQENLGKEDYDEASFNTVIIEIKEKLADNKDSTGTLATREEIERIIREAIEKYNLGDIITNIQIENLVVYFEKYQNTEAIDSEAVKEQLNNLSEETKEQIGNLIEKAKDAGVWDQVVQFFNDVIQAISRFFSSLGN